MTAWLAWAALAASPFVRLAFMFVFDDRRG